MTIRSRSLPDRLGFHSAAATPKSVSAKWIAMHADGSASGLVRILPGDVSVIAGRPMSCPKRHSFDVTRSVCVNLLGRRRRLPAAGSDSTIQLQHRAAFLDAGHYDPWAR